MKISVSIMTHFDRRPRAKALKAQLDAMWFEDVKIIYDVGLGEWDTGKRSMEHGIGKADWHVVLQDDAIISSTFFENLYVALSNIPQRSLVSLYLGRVKPSATQVNSAFNKAMASESSWISMRTLCWGVGVVIPTEDIEPMLENSKTNPRILYDRRIGLYYVNKQRKVYYTTISLVDHDYMLPSLTGHDVPDKPRVCHRFSGDQLIEFNSRCIAL